MHVQLIPLSHMDHRGPEGMKSMEEQGKVGP
jgi:hypothetical protein